ncbi:MAG: hypothetical protein EON59_05835 [Alphaproteobacteria bacterium]|nr:MAG: hypothetical protein EON59_05835 [Alphaproteobacteria bacterium]
MNDNDPERITPLHMARNRYVSAIRQMLLPPDMAAEASGEQPFVFMAGNAFDFETMKLTGAFARGLDCDIVYVAFEPGEAEIKRGGIYVVAPRDGVCHLLRDCSLWLDRDGQQALLVRPKKHAGHLACDGSEFVHLPGKPAKSLAPGFRRAETELLRRAAAMPEAEARRCYNPLWRAAA